MQRIVNRLWRPTDVELPPFANDANVKAHGELRLLTQEINALVPYVDFEFGGASEMPYSLNEMSAKICGEGAGETGASSVLLPQATQPSSITPARTNAVIRCFIGNTSLYRVAAIIAKEKGKN